MPPAPTRVFISYSHDSPAHKDRVLELSDRLREQGIDCRIDQYEESPREGWPNWCMNQVKESEFVLAVCTEIYERRFGGKEEPGLGRGVSFEGSVVTQLIYDDQSKNDKFVPVIFSTDDSTHIPTLLKGPSFYDLSTPEGYEQLYRRLTKQPLVKKPDLGEVRTMPPRGLAGLASLPKLQRKQEFLAPLWNVPLPPNPFFTGRERILEDIRKELASSERVALSGMRGVGKTQTAAQYAHRHRKDYQDVLWARAEVRETLIGDFVAIAHLLDLPQKDEKHQSVIVQAVKQWLQANSGWLLVLDNADDPALVREFVPLTHPGHVLLTTTARALGGFAAKVSVDEMDADEGALLLLRRGNLIAKDAPLEAATAEDQDLARKLARELGGLPLALDQAGAYIEETPSTLAEYRQLYEKEGARLRKQRGDLSTDHPSATVTFSLAFNGLAKRDSIAADLVRLCAFLAPDAIPEEVFTKGGSALGKDFAARAGNPLDFVETVKQASKFSLIRRDAPDRSLDIHRLVQDVLKDEMSTEQRREWAERAVRAVNLAFPGVEFANWGECERFLPHAKVWATLLNEFSLEFQEAARLLNQTAFYMDDRAQYAEAEPLYQRALAILEKALGPQHRDVATGLNNLAVLYNNRGRYAEAEPLHQRALAIREKALGADHPDVAQSLNNLAALYDNQARYAEAEPLYRRALAIDERALGADHPNLATDLNNLAEIYRNQGRYAEAEPLYQRALAIWEKALGPQHPHVAASLNNLAALYDEQERYAEAEPLFQRSIAIREKAFGVGHPKVATALENYGFLLRKTGRETEAQAMEARAKAIRENTKSQNKP